VFVVDRAPDRLERANTIGAMPVHFTKGDPATQIRDMRKRNTRQQSALGPEDRKMEGVMRGINAVGYQAHSGQDPDREDLCRSCTRSRKS